MLKNMKIGSRLGFGFGIIMVLLVVVGGFSIVEISQLGKELNTIVSDRFPKTVAANDIIDQVNAAARALRNMALLKSTQDVEKEYQRILEARKINGEKLKYLESSIADEKGKTLLKAMNEVIPDYRRQTDGYLELLKSGKRDAALTLLMGDLRSSQNAFNATVNDLIKYQTDMVNEAGKEAASEVAKARTIIIGLLIVALILGGMLGLLITRSIVRPVNACVDAANKIAAGDTDVVLDTTSKDETGVLQQAMAKMVEAINALIRDAGMLSEAAVAGKLATRADAKKHQGDFQKIVEGVNQTLDAVIGPLNVAAEYVDRISKGDIPPKIVDNYNGDFNEIKNNLNQCIEAVNALVADANMLSLAAVEGKLATRADAKKHQGDFQKIVEGVNQTLDAVIGPLNVAAEYVDRISKGDIPPKIVDNYNGDFNEIKNNLNQCIEAVNNLVADAVMLSKAAVEGKLATRADASKHHGDFQAIVQGVNECLDSVIGPLNVAAEYVDRISKGDIPPKIVDNYNGDFNEIKNNLNQCIEAVNALVADANMLSQAAVEGKLATRADASKHLGDFQKIVEGVNQTLDAVIGPLNVAAEYVDRISKGDIPPKIIDNYNGDFNEIKVNLNVLLEAMNTVTEAATQIGLGNLSVEVRERSPQDTLMQALSRMLVTLRELAKTAEKIADGDLTVNVKPASEDDAIGNAFATMVSNLREIVGNVGSSSGSIATATKQIATGNADLAQRTETQASSLEEIASSMEELTSTVKQNADNSQQANQLAIDASDVAVKGGTVITRVVDTMESISGSSKKIADIISVIDGIAFQTNILALNAAVEAARAGEQGRGFAVVAGEVRNLAQRSAAAAKEIKELISDSVDKVGNGSKLVGEAGQTMQEIVTSIKRVTDIMSEISAASLEQSSGIEQVNTAITSMDEITQQNASVVQEASSAAAALEEQAQLLVEAVNRFKLDESRKGQQHEVTRIQKQEPLITQAHAASKVGKHAKPGSTVPKANGYHATAPIAKAVGQDGDWNEF